MYIRDGKQITISKVDNGYIVMFPEPREDMAREMGKQLKHLVKENNLGIDLHEEDMFIKPPAYVDIHIKVFSSLKELLAFLKIQFDDKE